LVEGTLRNLRIAMAAPDPGIDARVDSEFDAARAYLETFRVDYERRHAEMFLQQIDAALLPEITSLLQTSALSAYFSASRKLDAELPRLFSEFGARMLDHARYRAD
jgi:hypothetical protein